MRRTSVKVARLDIAVRAAGLTNWFAIFQTFQWEGYETCQPVDLKVRFAVVVQVIKFGYSKNNEVQLSLWWPCELEEGGAGLEILDIEAVLTLLYSLYYKLQAEHKTV